MIGHQQILRVRNQGMKPATVYIETQFAPGKTSFDNPEIALDLGMSPTVYIPQNEMRKPHDFRFLTNCMVFLCGKEMTDDFIALAEKIATHTDYLIAHAAGDLLVFQHGAWNAYPNPG